MENGELLFSDTLIYGRATQGRQRGGLGPSLILEGGVSYVINPPLFLEDQYYKIMLILSINKYQIKYNKALNLYKYYYVIFKRQFFKNVLRNEKY